MTYYRHDCQKHMVRVSCALKWSLLIMACVFSPLRAGLAETVFDTPSLISSHVMGARSLWAADIDGDGDSDVLSAAFDDDTVAWHENTGGDGSAWSYHIISTEIDGPQSVYVADVDSDGDSDVLSASYEDSRIRWFENVSADGSLWTARTISSTALRASSVFAADLDSDGDMDALSASFLDNKIAWYENTAGDGSAWTEHTLNISAGGALSVFAADLNADNHTDVLSASYVHWTVDWYENDGSASPSFTTRVVSSAAVGPNSVFAADLDGDGDLDVLSTSYLDNMVAWYENAAGDGSSWTFHPITTSAEGARSVSAADLDNDGDTDVLSASAKDDTVAWYENQGGSSPSFTTRVITTSADGAYCVTAADIDGDGVSDVLSASALDDTVAWYKNLLHSPTLAQQWNLYE